MGRSRSNLKTEEVEAYMRAAPDRAKTCGACARHFGVSYHAMYNFGRRNGISFKVARKVDADARKGPRDRTKEIINVLRTGADTKYVCARFAMSRQAVHDLRKRYADMIRRPRVPVYKPIGALRPVRSGCDKDA